jgi:hypothetical protein
LDVVELHNEDMMKLWKNVLDEHWSLFLFFLFFSLLLSKPGIGYACRPRPFSSEEAPDRGPRSLVGERPAGSETMSKTTH